MKPTMFRKGRAKRRRVILSITILLMGLLTTLAPRLGFTAADLGNDKQRPQSRRQREMNRRPAAQKPRINYSRFSHATHVTQEKLLCDSCHKFPTKNWKDARKGDAAFPDVAEFPEHAACLNCHRPQFFARERPAPVICSNCHVNVTPRDTARFLFPSLGDVAGANLKRRELIP